MKIFIFERVEKLTGNYHPEGGLVAIAKDEDEVMRLVQEQESELVYGLRDNEWEQVQIFDLAEEVEPRLYVFPDAGCC